MSKREKQDYSKEFRQGAVRIAISTEKSNDEVSKAELFDELKRLKKELAEVKEQRDILKKATAYFAKESQ